MKRVVVWLASLALGACTTVGPAPAATPAACAMGAGDAAWVERALSAWRYSAREITGIGRVEGFEAILFDHACVLTSADALNTETAHWNAALHGDAVPLPGGEEVPAGVVSFATAEQGRAFLVMSAPSVWRAGGVDNPGIGLETMMVAVLLHEGSHVAQVQTYGARIGRIAEANHLPDDFNDDSIQRRFESDAGFAASVQRETDLFYEAAAAPDDATARRLAGEARALMQARMQRFYTGADAYLAEAEDVWLTMEGSGQFAGYRWLVDPQGGAAPADLASPNFARRSRWWSQNEGLGVFLALERIAGPGWRRVVYGGGERTALQLLDAALAAPPR